MGFPNGVTKRRQKDVHSRLDYVVADKNVEIEENRTLMGYQTYPVYIAKESKV